MHKHLITVIAGLGVVLLTILQAFFAEGERYSFWENAFLISCFVILGVGGFCSILAMRSLFHLVRDPDQVDTEKWQHRYVRTIIPGGALVVGMLLFCAFVYVYMRTRL